jgi:hypothetical protein
VRQWRAVAGSGHAANNISSAEAGICDYTAITQCWQSAGQTQQRERIGHQLLQLALTAT